MKKLTLSAIAALLVAAPAAAQSDQDALDARYDRALAAGYKALMLCSATWSAERVGGERSPESIHAYELTGIYPALDPIIRDLPYEILREGGVENAPVREVRVTWADDMPPRIATVSRRGGCFVEPIYAEPSEDDADGPVTVLSPLPADGWTTSEDGLSRSSANKLARSAFDGSFGEGSRTTAALVVVDGEIVFERYADGFGADTPQRTWSVAKSIAATLVGMSVRTGLYEINDPVGIGYWWQARPTDRRTEITIDHALRMATGRYSDTPGNRTDPLYWGGSTVDETVLHWPIVHAPGTVWRYANNDTLLAIKAVEHHINAAGVEMMLGEIGMHRSFAETDWRGGLVLSSQVWATARDLARLGQVHLDNPEVNGEPLLPEGWAGYVADPKGPQPEGRPFGYGAGWWTFARPEGNPFEGIPDDAFAAMGNRGQYVVVVPSRNVVIVRRGEDMVGTRFDIAAFTREVLSALED